MRPRSRPLLRRGRRPGTRSGTRPGLRPRLRTAAVAVLTVGLLTATPHLVATTSGAAARAVQVDESHPVPASGRFTVQGRGYGHGRGMSQHGAQGAALEGKDHEEILRFYYPGTELARGPGRIRVLVSADTGSDLVVVARSGLKLRDRGAGVTYSLPSNGAERWRLTVDGDNRAVVAYLAAGRWRPWAPGGEPTLVGEGEFRAPGPIELVTPAGVSAYRGWLRAAAPSEASTDRDTVNVLAMDDYVRGVVPAEMPASWEPEAVQSQAVAARTYASYHRARNLKRHYQVCDTTACQVYRGVAGEHPLGDKAVAATARQILTYDGEPAFTEFSASSGGWTTVGDFPYLTAQRDPYDGWSGNTVHTWSVPLAASRIEDAYPALGKLRRIRVTARDGNGQWRGRVLAMVLDGSKKDVRLSGDDFRWKFGLRSTWFTF